MRYAGHTIALIVAFWLHCASQNIAEAQDKAKHTPQVCTGYYPGRGWGLVEGFDFSQEWLLCPDDYAVFATSQPHGSPKNPAEVRLLIACCPLPAGDILLDVHEESLGDCAPNMVVTGMSNPNGKSSYALRCSAINTDRYELGAAQPGRMYGFGPNASLSIKESAIIRFDQLPAALRFGLGRTSTAQWEVSGCVGDPAGSLFVSKWGKRCKELMFKELRYRGNSGDSESGEPVKMYPNCREVPERFNEQAHCVEYNEHTD